jgi:hypothetical protein
MDMVRDVNFITKLTIIALSGLVVSPLAIAQSRSSLRVVDASNTDVINRLLNPGPSDPDVPLPRAGLGEQTVEARGAQGPSIYGRKEENGALLGLRVPIPAQRGKGTP